MGSKNNELSTIVSAKLYSQRFAERTMLATNQTCAWYKKAVTDEAKKARTGEEAQEIIAVSGAETSGLFSRGTIGRLSPQESG